LVTKPKVRVVSPSANKTVSSAGKRYRRTTRMISNQVAQRSIQSQRGPGSRAITRSVKGTMISAGARAGAIASCATPLPMDRECRFPHGGPAQGGGGDEPHHGRRQGLRVVTEEFLLRDQGSRDDLGDEPPELWKVRSHGDRALRLVAAAQRGVGGRLRVDENVSGDARAGGGPGGAGGRRPPPPRGPP